MKFFSGWGLSSFLSTCPFSFLTAFYKNLQKYFLFYTHWRFT
ncbi:hypothetical protein DESAMIL20_870 [Desulfurella amilsii]|uniref:Uncharacterized protein n=1 Tax=Desulfurella amilsii TaxID=1562698 RepID=A0A1X4XUV2_9BACT|nr:hypothetical protein DESAMIL20_870 [Desulfurella amilsii]